MKPQDFRIQDQEIIRRFLEARQAQAGEPERLKLSWSNWGFGSERLEDSAARLQRNGIEWIELHGNLYGPDLGYRAANVTAVLDAHGIAVSGICGMVTPEQELASNRPHVRQRFVDYLRRQLEFCTAVGGRYILFGAAAVGRPLAYDDHELARAAETLAVVADDFAAAGVLAAVEPIRPEETSIVHTCAEAAALIERVGHPGVQHIAGDLYHMLSGEGHVGRGVLEWAPRMANLHLADSNRRALGTGVLDLDVVIMALYAAGFNEGMRFCTAEPLGAGGDPYLQMFGPPDAPVLDALVAQTAETWRAREEAVLVATDDELLGLAGALPSR
jgi:D-psicose/D-tagatose/L-ribulose 3-epimerase